MINLDQRYEDYLGKLEDQKKLLERKISRVGYINKRRKDQQKISDFENRLLANENGCLNEDSVYDNLRRIYLIFENKKYEHGHGTTDYYYTAASVALNLLKRFENRQINEQQYKLFSEISFYDLQDLIYNDSKLEYRNFVYSDEHGSDYEHNPGDDKEVLAMKKVLGKYGFSLGDSQ